jgi:inhibitor of cysteine peptidase
MAKTARTLAVVMLFVGALAGVGLTLAVLGPAAPGTATGTSQDDPSTAGTTGPSLSGDAATVAQFQNRTAFEAYVAAGQRRAGSSTRWRVTAAVETPRAVADTAVSMEAGGPSSSSAPPERIAETNVQVGLLDEPDIVKTDGRNFYYAPPQRHYYPVEPRPERDTAVEKRRPEREPPETHVIDASDPDAPAVVSRINTSGKLLQTGDRLVAFESERVVGYDVSDPQNPTEAWSKPLNGSFVTAREANGTVYLVTESSVGLGTECPIRPLGAANAIACTDIYRPGTQIPADSTYSAFSIDAADGTVEDSVSFVGTARSAAVYMSPDALYVTYTQRADRAKLVGSYIQQFDRAPQSVRDRIAEIQSYDISTASKLREMRVTVQQWIHSLPAEQRQEVQEDYRSGLSTYLAEHKRTLTRTGIVRVDVNDGALSVDSTGVVPGTPLNQFAMDQHDGTLRIATTIPRTGDAESENDLYTLDAHSLERQGSVTGMGDDQRVYSVRYVGDTAYVVTFRQVDPLHVVDLSDPADPAERGTLELPGYSSYLHPVDDDTLLGIGEEDGQVKAVLFDVSDPANPKISDSKIFDQHYSSVAETHHAFLMDRKHGVFVLPAGTESLVVNYTDGDLTREATIETDQRATRTRYVEDSLYVFAGSSVTVVDETTWEETTTLSLDS